MFWWMNTTTCRCTKAKMDGFYSLQWHRAETPLVRMHGIIQPIPLRIEVTVTLSMSWLLYLAASSYINIYCYSDYSSG